MRILVCIVAFTLIHCTLLYADPPAFRTAGGDEKLPWFQPQPGQFPPEGSSHYFGGELIGMDHINRTGTLRLDRDDTQRRGEWDRSVAFTMLPYGSIHYRGAPAELRDVPIGTHLHVQAYVDEKAGKDGKGPFTRVLSLEDDFSRMTRLKRRWRVDAVERDKNLLTVTGIGPENQTDAKPTLLELVPSTRVWKGRGIGKIQDVAPGQLILANLTVCTLKGPGRCVEIWLDDESREVAAAHQTEVHRRFQREHGLAGWVDAVDNQERLVSIVLFDGFDRKLMEDFPLKGSAGGAVGEYNLRTYDQINDVMRGPIVEIQEVPKLPGSSGVRITFQPNTLIEGYRPTRMVRLFSGKWKVDDLPKEEQLYQ